MHLDSAAVIVGGRVRGDGVKKVGERDVVRSWRKFWLARAPRDVCDAWPDSWG